MEKEQFNEVLVKEAMNKLQDYYGTGNQFYPGMIYEFYDICKKDPNEIIEKAKELNLIK